ncbi:AAA family ATPase [Tardiphaga sp.]|uniref:AAA family ATPase n=1 Tax=Tardiphaga sp. TaxID=1926292 RepID=UPI00262F9BBF|nr:AAA family ATPase [Tardiphaga sp.]
MSIQEGVDSMQDRAVARGLDRHYGQDRVQDIIAKALSNSAISTVSSVRPLNSASNSSAAPAVIKATPYVWKQPSSIKKRDFLYGQHSIREFVSATVAPGGIGKSSLIVTEALAMVSGKALLGIQPASRLRVWLWNLEDPQEEIDRHIQATGQRYKLTAEDIEGYLFVDSGREQRLVITVTDRTGTAILEPIVDALVAELIRRSIDLLVVDPFVSSHEARENDNGAMDRIVKAWGRVAQRANCSIELVHHSRKSSAGATETTEESARGGKALTDGCRSVRVLNRMSKEEGKNAGVENPRSYFRVSVDKANLAPQAETSDWFHLESVDLGNNSTGGYGDSVGVVVSWQWPDLMADVSVSDLQNVQVIISKGRFRASVQSLDWAGHAVAEACRLDLAKAADKRKASNLLKAWTASGALKLQTAKDAKGNNRPFIVVGKRAND